MISLDGSTKPTAAAAAAVLAQSDKKHSKATSTTSESLFGKLLNWISPAEDDPQSVETAAALAASLEAASLETVDSFPRVSILQGIPNRQNSCYLNGLIQAIKVLEPYTEALHQPLVDLPETIALGKIVPETPDHRKKREALRTAICDLLRVTSIHSSQAIRLMCGNLVIDALFDLGEGVDIQDEIIEVGGKNVSDVVKERSKTYMQLSGGTVIDQTRRHAQHDPSAILGIILEQLLPHLKLKTKTTRSAGDITSEKTDTACFLTLPFIPGEARADIQKMIDAYATPRVMNDQWRTDGPDEALLTFPSFTETCRLVKSGDHFPEVLPIQLARFSSLYQDRGMNKIKMELEKRHQEEASQKSQLESKAGKEVPAVASKERLKADLIAKKKEVYKEEYAQIEKLKAQLSDSDESLTGEFLSLFSNRREEQKKEIENQIKSLNMVMQEGGQKIDTPTTCHPNLLLDLNTLFGTNNDKGAIYQLTSYEYHRGGLAGGHYVTCAKIESQWYEYNDGRPVQCLGEKLPDSFADAYLLFYKPCTQAQAVAHLAEASLAEASLAEAPLAQALEGADVTTEMKLNRLESIVKSILARIPNEQVLNAVTEKTKVISQGVFSLILRKPIFGQKPLTEKERLEVIGKFTESVRSLYVCIDRLISIEMKGISVVQRTRCIALYSQIKQAFSSISNSPVLANRPLLSILLAQANVKLEQMSQKIIQDHEAFVEDKKAFYKEMDVKRNKEHQALMSHVTVHKSSGVAKSQLEKLSASLKDTTTYLNSDSEKLTLAQLTKLQEEVQSFSVALSQLLIKATAHKVEVSCI